MRICVTAAVVLLLACPILLFVPAGGESPSAPEEAAAHTPAPSADEMNLDRLLSVYEDVAAALTNVDDSTGADLVASRVAADFLLLRGFGRAMAGIGAGADVGTENLRSFKTRCDHARTAVDSAIARLRKSSCFGSEALPAALSLSGLMSGKPLSLAESQAAVQELLCNNREMVAMLLDEARDAASAEQVADLIAAALQCEIALAAYAAELGHDDHLDEERREAYAQRRSDFIIDMQNHSERLKPVEYYGNVFLQEFVESRAASTDR